MKVVVHDASILIDLALSKTVEAWFASGIETWTTDFIYPSEISQPEQCRIYEAYAAAQKLRIRCSTPAELETIVRYRKQLGLGLSLADVSVILAAKSFGDVAILATGDRALRNVAVREKVRVCGILGLFDVMVKGTESIPPVLPFLVAIEKLRNLMQLPECRLPADRCAERLRLWSLKRHK